MVFSVDMPSPSSIFSTYASMAGCVMMIRTMIPQWVQNRAVSYIMSLLGTRLSSMSTLTLVISNMTSGTDRNGMSLRNELYTAAEAYVSSKISPDVSKLRMTTDNYTKKPNLYLSQGEVTSDIYEGIELKWRYLYSRKKSTINEGEEEYDQVINCECLELSFEKKHRDLVLNSYIPYVESKAKVIKDERRILKMYSYSSWTKRWEFVNFEHPSTFDTMAMNEELKLSVIGDLDRFIGRKNFYKRVGKAWKRGYLLYGPPGTGKSSLVAAMANYLKFDIYDLQLASVKGDADLRKLLLATTNSSILLVEDIDCSMDLPTRLQPATNMSMDHGAPKVSTGLTLSGLLNCIDGLWSSCGDERIVIFTTNNKEMLDPALLRPGRMDKHIYMGHCGFEGFKTLASNYLGLSHENDATHRLYPDIKRLIDGQVLTPAQVAEELMKNEDADMALEGLVSTLKRKRSESEKCDAESKKVKTLEEGDKKKSDVEEI